MLYFYYSTQQETRTPKFQAITFKKKHDYHKRKHASFLKPTPKQKQDRLSVAGGRSFTMPYIPKTAYLRCFGAKKKNGRFLSKLPFLCGGVGGIRTHVPVKANAFRVRPVMTASIPLQIVLIYFITQEIKSQYSEL